MESHNETEGQNSVSQLLAARFRKERQRLNLTTAAVAHYCDVSVSSVFSWESGRARIPLAAAACLWEYGFDVEALIEGKHTPESVRTLSKRGSTGVLDPICLMPRHKLRRFGLQAQSSFVYHNIADADDIAAPGEILLLGCFSQGDAGALVEQTRNVLLRPKADDYDDIICRLQPSGKTKLKLSLGNVSSVVRIETLLSHAEPQGYICCCIGSSSPGPLPDYTHMDTLSDFVELLVEKPLASKRKSG